MIKGKNERVTKNADAFLVRSLTQHFRACKAGGTHFHYHGRPLIIRGKEDDKFKCSKQTILNDYCILIRV